MSYDRWLVIRSIAVSSWFRVAPLLALVPACVVSFNDYPVGELRHENLAGGQSTGGGGSGDTTGGVPGAGSSSSGGVDVGGSGSTSGSDVGGGGSGVSAGSGGTIGGGGSSSAGTSPFEVAGEAGLGSEGGMPSVEPVTVEITDVVDTYVSENSPSSNYGNEKTLIMDRNTGTGGPGGPGGWEGRTHEVLLRATLDTIPTGAQISAATLTLKCMRVGDAITASYLEQAWQETTVNWYNTMNATAGASLGSTSADATGTLAIDLRVAVAAWVAGDHGNFGVLLSPDGLNATECASSEADDLKQRPRLSITYTAPN